jgi:hypothetical protein
MEGPVLAPPPPIFASVIAKAGEAAIATEKTEVVIAHRIERREFNKDMISLLLIGIVPMRRVRFRALI